MQTGSGRGPSPTGCPAPSPLRLPILLRPTSPVPTAVVHVAFPGHPLLLTASWLVQLPCYRRAFSCRGFHVPDGRNLGQRRECFDLANRNRREDMATASLVPEGERPQLFTDLASAAESGWDFSSRWLREGLSPSLLSLAPCHFPPLFALLPPSRLSPSQKGTHLSFSACNPSIPFAGSLLSTIRTTSVIPADLNAFLYKMERNVASLAAALGDSGLQSSFHRMAAERLASINGLMWDERGGQWRDLVISPKEPVSLLKAQNDLCPLPLFISGLFSLVSAFAYLSISAPSRIPLVPSSRRYSPTTTAPLCRLSSLQQSHFPHFSVTMLQTPRSALQTLAH